MATAPWMRWNPADYRADPRVKLLTFRQDLLYRRCLEDCHLGGGKLSQDPEKIRKLVDWPAEWWEEDWAEVSRFFQPHPDEPKYLTNKRVMEDLQVLSATSPRSRGGRMRAASARRAPGGRFAPADQPNIHQSSAEPAESHVRDAEGHESPIYPALPASWSSSAGGAGGQSSVRGVNGSESPNDPAPPAHADEPPRAGARARRGYPSSSTCTPEPEPEVTTSGTSGTSGPGGTSSRSLKMLPFGPDESPPRPPSRGEEPPAGGSKKISRSGKKETPAKLPEKLPGFDRFWEVYPRRKAKESARRAYKTLLRRSLKKLELKTAEWQVADEKLARFLVARVKAQLSWDWGSGLNKEDQFVPYPATWMNGGHYDDEPDEE